MERWCIALSRESKLLSLLLLIVMLCTSVLPVFAQEGTEAEPEVETEAVHVPGPNVPEGYVYVGCNESFNLYLLETNMALVIERKDTGDVLFSTVQNGKTSKNMWTGLQQSGVVIEYLRNVEDKPAQADFVNNAYTIAYTYAENGFTAHVSFTDLGISFDVQVEINEAGLTVALDPDSITEVRDETYMILRNADGQEERIAIAKYNAKKLEDRRKSEIMFTTSGGLQYKLTETGVVPKDGKVTVKTSEGGTCTLPLAADTPVSYTVTTKKNKTYDLPAVFVSAVDANGTVYIDDSACLKAYDAKGKLKSYLPILTEEQTYLSMDDVKTITRTPTISIPVTDASGAAKTISAYDIVSFTRNTFISVTALDGTELRVAEEQIVELSDNSYVLASVYLYPFMAYSEADVGQGYMIIPDGQGAIVGFENNEKRYTTPYDKPVYGINIGADIIEDNQRYSNERVEAETVLAPFFGMVHTDKQMAVLGVIEEGDIAARIIAYPNGVRNMDYDWVTAKYCYRFVFQQPMGPGAGNVATRNEHRRNFDIKQHFLLACGEEATYAGLAVAYRDYLVGKGSFANADQRDFDIQIDFLGLERENFILGKQDVVMTTFEEAGEIVNQLYAQGVENMSVVYRGWQTNGLTGGLPTDSYSPARGLGGRSGLAELREQMETLGVDLSLETDLLSLNLDTHPGMMFNAFKRITGETWSRPTYGKVYDTLHYLNPITSRDVGLDLLEEMDEAGMHSVTFKGITQLLSDYYHRDSYHDVSEMAALYMEIIEKAEETMTINMVSPNAYLWEHADVISDIPIAGSDFTYTDAEIPFLTIALSGQIPCYVEYTNFQANTREFFLHLIEQGTRPTFLLTMEDPIELQNSNSSNIYSSRFELYESMIVEWYDELKALHEVIGPDGMIVDHVRSGDMVRVTWSNGTQVYLNFGDFPATMDDVTLEKLSYQIKEVNGGGN